MEGIALSLAGVLAVVIVFLIFGAWKDDTKIKRLRGLADHYKEMYEGAKDHVERVEKVLASRKAGYDDLTRCFIEANRRLSQALIDLEASAEKCSAIGIQREGDRKAIHQLTTKCEGLTKDIKTYEAYIEQSKESKSTCDQKKEEDHKVIEAISKEMAQLANRLASICIPF